MRCGYFKGISCSNCISYCQAHRIKSLKKYIWWKIMPHSLVLHNSPTKKTKIIFFVYLESWERWWEIQSLFISFYMTSLSVLTPRYCKNIIGLAWDILGQTAFSWSPWGDGLTTLILPAVQRLLLLCYSLKYKTGSSKSSGWP